MILWITCPPYVFRDELVYNIDPYLPGAAIRVENMKLIIQNEDPSASDWTEPPENVDNGVLVDVECAEEDTTFAGFGIEGNQVNDVTSAGDCQQHCQVKSYYSLFCTKVDCFTGETRMLVLDMELS